jgi:hypothetical protein
LYLTRQIVIINLKCTVCSLYLSLIKLLIVEYRLISKKGEGTFSEVLKA